jgi:hypothetical protein
MAPAARRALVSSHVLRRESLWAVPRSRRRSQLGDQTGGPAQSLHFKGDERVSPVVGRDSPIVGAHWQAPTLRALSSAGDLPRQPVRSRCARRASPRRANPAYHPNGRALSRCCLVIWLLFTAPVHRLRRDRCDLGNPWGSPQKTVRSLEEHGTSRERSQHRTVLRTRTSPITDV